MYRVRRWVVRHSRAFEILYGGLESMLIRLDPLWRRLGHERLEVPFSRVEKVAKGLLFDCRMCGQCTLGATGMSCPMNCPKQLRNGPCGGVRGDGRCEVKPEMVCVWVDAWTGSQAMKGESDIQVLQDPVDFRLAGSSSWLRVVREASRGTGGDGRRDRPR